MLSEPQITHRDEQHSAAIRVHVEMHELADVVPPLCTEIRAWLAEHEIEPAGPAYFRYLVIDMEQGLSMEAGIPVADPIEADDRVDAGHLPSGVYVTATHTGHPDDLEAATAELLQWGTDNSIEWQKSDTAEGEAWVARTEFYLTDPADEPDMSTWVTELAFLTKIHDSSS